MKNLVAILLAVLLLALVGCGAQASEPTTTATPTTLPPTADIGGTEVLLDVQELDLSQLTYNMDALLAAAAELNCVTKLELGCTELSAQDVAALREAFPTAEVAYSLELFGQPVDLETTELEMQKMDLEQDSLTSIVQMVRRMKRQVLERY